MSISRLPMAGRPFANFGRSNLPRYADGIALGLAAGALWGGVFLALQVLSSFSAIQITSGRYIAYGGISALLLIFFWRGAISKLDRHDVFALIWLSALGHIVYHVFLTLSVHWIGIAATALIIGLLPITISIAGSRQSGAITLRVLAGPLITIGVGIFCINVDVFQDVGPGGDWAMKAAGIGCAFAALAAWTIYAVANTSYLQRNPNIMSSEWALLTGMVSGALAAVLAVYAFLFSSRASPGLEQDWNLFLIVMVATALGASVLGNGLWNAASRRVPLTLVGQLIVFETLFGLLYGFLYYGRWPRLLEWAAIILLPGGVIWSARLHGKQRSVSITVR